MIAAVLFLIEIHDLLCGRKAGIFSRCTMTNRGLAKGTGHSGDTASGHCRRRQSCYTQFIAPAIKHFKP